MPRCCLGNLYGLGCQQHCSSKKFIFALKGGLAALTAIARGIGTRNPVNARKPTGSSLSLGWSSRDKCL